MAEYQKLDIAAFKEKLNGGGYKSAGGARKALGKAKGLSSDERDKALKLINKHFGDVPTPPPKPAAKAPRKKKAAAKAPKAAKAPRATTKTAGRTKKSVVSQEDPGTLARGVIDTAHVAIASLKEIPGITDGKLDVTKGLESSAKAIEGAMDYLNRALVSQWGTPQGNGASTRVESSEARKFAESKPSNVGIPGSVD